MIERRQALREAILSANSDAISVGPSLDIIISERLRQRHWDGYSRILNGGAGRYDEAGKTTS